MCFLWRLALVVLFAGSSAASFAATPNIVLITLDTTRADRIGFLGCKRGLTPNLDMLAKQSLVFTHAYAHVPLTTPSHATILTGTYPQFNQITDLGNALANDIPYLPEILHRRGYATAAFVGSQVLDPAGVGAPGFARGFDRYDANFHSRGGGEDRYQSIERRGVAVVDRASAWVLGHSRGPFFLWVHLYDPHDPYDPPEPFKSRYRDQLYDGEIAYTDFALGKLFSVLRSHALYANAVIAVMADHGEALGEHGEATHGVFLYDETIHVPLVIKLPASREAGMRIESRVGLVDVAPTLLNIAGLEALSAMQGTALVGKTKAKAGEPGTVNPAADRASYAETDYPRRAFGWSSLRSLRIGKYLYIQAPRLELYDQSSDPTAIRNLASEQHAVAETLSSQLQQFRQGTSRAAAAKVDLRPEQAEQLQALGYVATSEGSSQTEAEMGADPKDKIEIANLMHEALVASEEDRYSDAVAPLQRVLKEQPSSGLANLELGKALNRLQRSSEALPYLKRAVELVPQSGRAHYELGVALMETSELAKSAIEFEAAVSRASDSPDMHFSLGSAYEKMGRGFDAAREYKTALRLDSRHFLANLMLGRMLGMENQPAEALPYLQTAADLNPRSVDAHKFLANVYSELGQPEKASRERAEAEQLSNH
jgi:choline-sulfatase